MGEGGPAGGGGWGRGRGWEHFIHLAIYCTTTWCFALKGLRTTRDSSGTPDVGPLVLSFLGPPLGGDLAQGPRTALQPVAAVCM